MSVLEYDTRRIRQGDKAIFWLEFESNGKANGNKYKVENFLNDTVYIKDSETKSYLPGFYYLVLWKKYLEKKNI